MRILIDNRQTKININPEDLQTKTEQILEGLGYSSETSASISIVNSDEMTELNHTYRGKNGPTNVLSFSQSEGLKIISDRNMLGDVVICSDRARSDAEDLGYTDDEMILYLLIHGLLHLHGLHHDSPLDAEQMTGEVNDIFHKFFD